MTDKTLGITAEMDIDDVLSGLSELTQELGDIPTSINTDINLADSGTSIEEVSDLKTDLTDVDGMVATPTIDVEGDTSEITTAEEEMTELDGEVATPTIDVDAGSIEEAASAASALGDYLSEDATDAGNVSTNLDATSESADAAAGSASTMDSALAGITSLGIAATLDAAVTSAGNFNDSWNRLAISMGESNQSISDTKSEWSSTISEIQGTTDRTAGNIRTALINLGTAGVHSKDTLVTSVDAISGHAYAIGSSVSAVSSTFESAVQRSTFSARNLISLGLNSQDVLNGTGMTIDQLSTAWKTADSNQKALWLSEIMNAHDGTSANEDYKNSWNAVADQLDAAWEYVSRIGGALLLPGAKSAATSLANALKDVAGWVDKLSPGVKSFLGNILGLVAGVAVISGLVQAFKKVKDALNIVGNIKAVGSAINGLPTLPSRISTSWKNFKEVMRGTEKEPTLIGKAINAIPNIPDKVKDSFSKIKDVATSAGGSVKDKLGSVIEKLSGVPSKVSDSFSKLKTLAYDVGGTVTSKLGSAIEKLKGVPSSVVDSFGKLKDAIIGTRVAQDEETAAENRGIIAKTKAALASAAKAAKEAISTAATKLATAAQAAYDAVMDANPITLVVLAIAALVLGLAYLYTHVKSVHDAINNFGKALQDFWNWLTHLNGNDIWKWIWSGVQDAIKHVTDPWDNFVSFIKGLPSNMQKYGQDIIKALITGVTAAIPGLTPALQVISALFPHSPPKSGPLSTITASGMTSWISGIFTGAVNGIKNASNTIISAFRSMVSGLLGVDAQIRAAVKNMGLTIINTLKAIPGQVSAIGQKIWTGLTSGVSYAIADVKNAWNQIKAAFTGFINYLKNLPATIAATATKIWTSITTGVENGINTLKSKINGLIAWIRTLPGILQKDAQNAIDGIKTGITNGIRNIVSALKTLETDFMNGVKWIESIPQKMYNWGKQIIDGLVNGIKSGMSDLTGALGELNSLFPHSPPKTGPLSEITAGNMQSWASNISQAGVSGFSEMTSGVASTLSQMSINTSSTLSQIQSTVSNFSGQIQSSATQMFSIGQSIINNLTSGLENGIPDLSNVFSQISNMFPHSPPKEGPLSTIKAENMQSWGQGLALAGAKGLSGFSGYMNNLVKIPSLPSISSGTGLVANSEAGQLGNVIYLEVAEGAVQIHGNADKNVVNQGGNLLGNSISSSLQKGAVTNGLKPTVILRR
jgi:phage-related protein